MSCRVRKECLCTVHVQFMGRQIAVAEIVADQ